MSFFYYNHPQKRSKRQLLETIFVLVYSFFTPHSIKIRRLKKIENRAKEIAKENRIPFPINCKMIYRKGRTFYSIGYSDKTEPKVEGKFNVYIYSSHVMASEIQILLTIFHEYGHFLHDYTSLKTIFPVIEIYCKKNSIEISGDFVEDFCEIFAQRVLDIFRIDKEFSDKMDIALNEAFFMMKKDGVDLDIS